jgi:phage N-6-adenine-methyltransferase
MTNSDEKSRCKPTDERETPQWFYNVLDKAYHFTVDVAASAGNTKCGTFLLEGLQVAWRGHVWCNPPYSNVRPWIDKAWYDWERLGPSQLPLIVMLLPADTSTHWFHEGIWRWRDEPGFTITYLQGRMAFLPHTAGAKKGSMLCVWDRRKKAQAKHPVLPVTVSHPPVEVHAS